MKVFCFLFFCAISVFAQPDTLALNITFPADQDTFAVDRLRISGNTHPEAVLAINNKPVKLLHQGAFVTRIDLQDGMNKITTTARYENKQAEKILYIYRPPQLVDFADRPTSIDPLWVEPKTDVWVRPGDLLNLTIKGSPQAQATFEIEKIGNNYSMTELAPQQAKNLLGVYHGSFIVPEFSNARALEIEFQLRGTDGRKKTYTAPGKLHIMPSHYPIIGVTRKETYIQAESDGHAPLQRLANGIYVHIVGRINDRYKIQLSPDLVGWIDSKNIIIRPIGTPVPNVGLAAPQPAQTNDWLKLIMPIDYPVPFIVQKNGQPNCLSIDLYCAHQASHWITYPNTPIDIQNLVFQQTQTGVVHIQLTTPFNIEWGYRVFYQDCALHFYVRRPPMITPENPFQNITIAVDAGHGGSEDGAIGALGLKEKDVNLRWANKLKMLLRTSGAKVIMTRAGDDSLALSDRVKIAEQGNAHIYLSLHNNAVGASGNALRAGGTSVYFTLMQNKDLCWAIYPHMFETGLAPYGKIYNSYYITTTPSFLTALVEGCFITNPREELMLMDETFVDKMALAVYRGVEDFLLSKVWQVPQ